jgi:hypothetical protein
MRKTKKKAKDAKNKIVVGVIAALVVASIGYAAYNYSQLVTGDATVSGKFDMTLACNPGYGEAFINAGLATSANEGQAGYSNDDCSVDDNKVSFNVDYNLPSASRVFTIAITNDGTMDSVFKGFNKVSDKLCIDKDGDETLEDCTNYTSEVNPIEMKVVKAVVKLKDGSYIDATSSYTSTTLSPGEVMYLAYASAWDKDLTDYNHYKSDLTAELQFEQQRVNQ